MCILHFSVCFDHSVTTTETFFYLLRFLEKKTLGEKWKKRNLCIPMWLHRRSIDSYFKVESERQEGEAIDVLMKFVKMINSEGSRTIKLIRNAFECQFDWFGSFWLKFLQAFIRASSKINFIKVSRNLMKFYSTLKLLTRIFEKTVD